MTTSDHRAGASGLTVTARHAVAAGAGLVLALAVARPAAAQQALATRVAAVKDGTVQFEFPSREDACGDGHSYIRVGDSMNGSFNSGTDLSACEPGPVRIVLGVSGGRVTRLHDYLGPVPQTAPGVTELGEVSAAEGSAYLLGLVESEQESRVANQAVFPAMLARDVVAWPTLLRVAKAERSGRARRQDVMFWLGRYAAAKLNGSDDPFYASGEGDESDEESVKEHAVFALSQLGHGNGIEPLIQVARTNKDPRVRAKALFWLGQSGDPRALDLFEQLLTGRVAAPQG